MTGSFGGRPRALCSPSTTFWGSRWPEVKVHWQHSLQVLPSFIHSSLQAQSDQQQELRETLLYHRGLYSPWKQNAPLPAPHDPTQAGSRHPSHHPRIIPPSFFTSPHPLGPPAVLSEVCRHRPRPVLPVARRGRVSSRPGASLLCPAPWGLPRPWGWESSPPRPGALHSLLRPPPTWISLLLLQHTCPGAFAGVGTSNR